MRQLNLLRLFAFNCRWENHRIMELLMLERPSYIINPEGLILEEKGNGEGGGV